MPERSANDRIRSLLEACFDALEEGRDPDVEALCAGDEHLATRVRSLIAQDPEATGVFRRSPEAGSTKELPAAALGGFDLVAPIGEGGMGRVYLAEDRRLGRMVALKVFDPAQLSAPHARLRFQREAAIAAAIDHPSIVPIHAIGEDRGFLFIAMKWLSGPGLDSLEAPMPPRRAAAVGAAVARALEEAHLAGVVHRDVKPGNVILDGDVPYLVDFGLARTSTDHTLTRTGAIPGTLPYMAPEQLRGGAIGLDPRADVYSLGATLYEVVTGRMPFPPETPERLIRDILQREPPALALAGADRDLEVIILRALRKDREQRFPSAAEMADDLDRYLERRPIRSRPIRFSSRAWSLARRHRGAAALTGVLVAALLVLATIVAIGHVGEARRIESKLVQLDEALRSGDDERAEAMLHGEDAADPRIARRWRRYHALAALSELLDQLIVRPNAQAPSVLENLERAAEATGAFDLHPREGSIARALLAFHRGDRAAARRRIEAVRRRHGDTRGLAALHAALAGATEVPRELPARSDEDHVLTSLAMSLAGAPPELRRRELAEALRRPDAGRRVKLAEAIRLASAGHARAALAMYDTMRDERRAVIMRQIARLELALGRVDDAERTLAGIGEEQRTPFDDVLTLEILVRRDRPEEVEARLDAVRRKEPGHADVRLFEAQWRAWRGQRKQALELLRAVEKEASWHRHREWAAACRLSLEATAALATGDAGGPQIENLDARAAALAEEARYGRARGRAVYVRGMIAAHGGRTDEAIELMRRAHHIQPGYVHPPIDFAALVEKKVRRWAEEHGRRRLDDALIALVEEGREMLARVLDDEPGREYPLTVEQRRHAVSHALRLAYLRSDGRAIRRWLPMARDVAERLDPADPDWEDALDELAERYGLP